MKIRILTAVLFAFAVSACGHHEPAAIPAASAPAVAPPKEEHVSVPGMTVDSGANVALPADFPKDIPIPAGAVLTDAISMGKINVVAFRLSGDPTSVFATLLPLYQAQGWKNYSRVGGEPVLGTDGFEKDGRRLIYTVVPDGTGSKVSLRHYPPMK